MGENRKELLERAGMNQYELNTGVVSSTSVGKSGNEDLRIQVHSAVDNNWGDCVGVGVYMGDHMWKYGHFSPARARILAQKLLEHAERLEKSGNPGMSCIDTPSEFFQMVAARMGNEEI